jgi:thioredoxin-dependent peroxiredoxin
MNLQEGQMAPDFELLDQNNNKQTLSNYRGQWLLLYFYPKDDTPGCTKEACNFRDNWEQFNQAKTMVMGVSTDSVKSHQKFAEKYGLHFPLLSDEEKKIVKEYGVWQPKKMLGKEFMGTVRSSFLINPEGRIAKIYERVKPEGHAMEVWKDYKAML